MMRHITFVVRKETNEVYAGANKANGSYPKFLKKYDNDTNILVDVSTDDERFTNPSNLKYENGEIVVDEEKMAKEYKEFARQQYKREREESLNSATVEVGGIIFDARKGDVANYEGALELGDYEIIANNNSVVEVTIEQLNEIILKTKLQIKDIYATYKANIKTL